jgi:hypothetical protein
MVLEHPSFLPRLSNLLLELQQQVVKALSHNLISQSIARFSLCATMLCSGFFFFLLIHSGVDKAANFKNAGTMSIFSKHDLNVLKRFGDFELYYLVPSRGKTELDGRFGLVSQALKLLRLHYIMEVLVDLQKRLSEKLSKFNSDTMIYVVTMFFVFRLFF